MMDSKGIDKVVDTWRYTARTISMALQAFRFSIALLGGVVGYIILKAIL